jgi:hypothetical protein
VLNLQLYFYTYIPWPVGGSSRGGGAVAEGKEHKPELMHLAPSPGWSWVSQYSARTLASREISLSFSASLDYASTSFKKKVI